METRSCHRWLQLEASLARLGRKQRRVHLVDRPPYTRTFHSPISARYHRRRSTSNRVIRLTKAAEFC